LTRSLILSFLILVAILPSAHDPAAQGVCEPAYVERDAPADAFEFLRGKWKVYEEESQVAEVEVQRDLRDKVLRLRWTVPGSDYQGHSFLGLDQQGRWTQTWVDSSSTPFFLFYHGGVEDDRRELSSE
jgi:hypothetical protein